MSGDEGVDGGDGGDADVDDAGGPNSTVDVPDALASVAEATPLVNALTNEVTVNDVANCVLHWGGLPVMSDDEREVADMVAGAQACLLNMGTVSETGESAMLAAGHAANDHGVPVVVDPVGVGATPTRSRVAARLVTDVDAAVVKGNYGEVSALAADVADHDGTAGEVRGVESVGEYADIAESAVALARETGAVVVASGEVDVVATGDAAHEVRAGDPMMGTVVGTGCMLGATLAAFAGSDVGTHRAALAGTAAFGLAGEAAADGRFGEYHGPASYRVSFLDAVAGLADADPESGEERVERVVGR